MPGFRRAVPRTPGLTLPICRHPVAYAAASGRCADFCSGDEMRRRRPTGPAADYARRTARPTFA
jgi:hypothetical protein